MCKACKNPYHHIMDGSPVSRAHDGSIPAIQVLYIICQCRNIFLACDDDPTRHGSPDELVAADTHRPYWLLEGHHRRHLYKWDLQWRHVMEPFGWLAILCLGYLMVNIQHLATFALYISTIAELMIGDGSDIGALSSATFQVRSVAKAIFSTIGKLPSDAKNDGNQAARQWPYHQAKERAIAVYEESVFAVSSPLQHLQHSI